MKDVSDAIFKLLAARAEDGTICPSEVARTISTEGEGAHEEWRKEMPLVHEAVDRLLAEKRERLSWKGKELASRSGPYRIARRGDH